MIGAKLVGDELTVLLRWDLSDIGAGFHPKQCLGSNVKKPHYCFNNKKLQHVWKIYFVEKSILVENYKT